jgi:hypothetical protein
MITREQIPRVLGHTAYDRTHKKLGRVGQVFIDDETGAPEWITVQTGMFGTKETFVPLQPAELQGDEVVVPFEQERIKDAPKVETEAGHLTPSEEARLYDYYGMQYQPYAGTEAGIGPETEAAPEAPAPEAAAPEAEVRLRRYTRTEFEERTVPGEQEPTVRETREQAAEGEAETFEDRGEGEWRG